MLRISSIVVCLQRWTSRTGSGESRSQLR